MGLNKRIFTISKYPKIFFLQINFTFSDTLTTKSKPSIFDPIFNIFQKQPTEVFCKEKVLKNFAKLIVKQLPCSPFFDKVAGWKPAASWKNILTQVLSCGFCEILKNTFFREHSGRLIVTFFLSECDIQLSKIFEYMESHLKYYKNYDFCYYNIFPGKRRLFTHFNEKTVNKVWNSIQLLLRMTKADNNSATVLSAGAYSSLPALEVAHKQADSLS